MKISVASGKGGTGKTTIALNLALSLRSAGKRVHLMDCDVEEPDTHLFLGTEMERTQNVNLLIPEVDMNRCTLCGECARACEFNAIAVIGKKVMVFPELCHGCNLCGVVCPVKAISEKPHTIGVIEQGKAFAETGEENSGNGLKIDFTIGRLNIGEPMATPVIREEKRLAIPEAVNIIDSPPGTSCPVIEAIHGTDFTILVTEPTPFGLYDLKLAVGVVRELGVPFGVVLNRSDIGDARVTEYCRNEGIPLLMEIPFDRKIAELYSRGLAFVTALPDWRERFLRMFGTIEGMIGSTETVESGKEVSA